MGFLDIITNNRVFNKDAKLLIDIVLDNGETRNIGDIVSILIDYGNGYYHAEDNEFACKVHRDEVEFI